MPMTFRYHNTFKTASIVGAFLQLMLGFPGQKALALDEVGFVETNYASDAFPLFHKTPAVVMVDSNDWPGVVRATDDLATDIKRVTGQRPRVVNRTALGRTNVVIIGTIGKSRMINVLVRDKKIDVTDVAGKWESYFLQVVKQPFPGVENALVICGSDKRGTIYGIYDLSEQIGVSPWYWWADVPPKHHDQLFVKAGKYVQGPPSVKYRGIFLNDEAPDLSGWIQEKYGRAPGYSRAANYGPGFYTNLFELMLRLKANFLWPAMWNNAFNEDDTNNPRLADEYGIVMGTSHQEPMLRAQKEWDRKHPHDNWNHYVETIANSTNLLQQFWRNGIIRNKNYENILTVGARGEDDSPLLPNGTIAENIAALSNIINVQSNIIAGEINPNVSKVPQLWCPYKEVLGYYNDGFRVPDYVTILWTDDNWGNLRHLPAESERQRNGGAGIYYHFDYVGGPRNYRWINTDPIPKIWDQMSLAKQYGADRIWIVNVGHFKGYEFPLEFFMDLAWNTPRWTSKAMSQYPRLWAEQQFGPKYAAQIGDILTLYTKHNGRRKPELLDANTYSLVDYDEFQKVVDDYMALADKAEQISAELPPASRDAFYELVLFPTKACAQLNAMYLAAAKNALYAKQGRASANDYAAKTRELFTAETNLMSYFNHAFAGGKWDHFMDQPFIGYKSWGDPRRNNLHEVNLTEIPVPKSAAIGVAVENSETAATNGEISLPQFDVFNQQRFYVDVFNRGKTPFDFSAIPDSPWIILSDESGTIDKQKRIWVSVDWSKAPNGTSDASIKFSGVGGKVVVKTSTFKPTEPTPESLQGFAEGDGYVSMESAHYTQKTDVGSNRWVEIPNYGKTLSGMRACGPAYDQATPGKDSPCLEYKMYLFNAGKVDVETTVSPTLNFLPGRPLRYAVSFDNGTPRIVTFVPANFNANSYANDWPASVENNCRHVRSTFKIDKLGYHILKIWMVDPGVMLEKIVVNTGDVKPSYLGPPESFYK
jgi:hypothetical protein